MYQGELASKSMVPSFEMARLLSEHEYVPAIPVTVGIGVGSVSVVK